MKKQHITLLMCITLIFCAFLLGFFLGRNQNHEVVHISSLSLNANHNITPTMPSEIPDAEEVHFPININDATLQELMALPGIGETIAKRIVDFRKFNGNFAKPEELLHVDGIGPSKLEAILDYITTGG